jgi:hypothetical protein
MGARLCKAVLDLAVTDFDGINKQARLFLDNLYKEKVLYPDPWVSEKDFSEQAVRSAEATVAAIGAGKKERAKRNMECRKTHWLMANKLILYINSLYKGDRVKIEKSGAKISADYSPVPPPDKPIIKEVKRGPLPNTVKIYLCRGINSKQKRRSRISYRIFMHLNTDDIQGTEVGTTYSSTNLIGEKIPYDTYLYYSVVASSSNGSSSPSEMVRFWLSPY